ncbi:putative gustatory receptor 59d [Drosophila tropicalis]|uniref:putative gustatory receptor 59d n=1 Tax=Drosophila tropicalis TaxID=46794 RepID=UPI0035AC0B4F
MALIRVVGVFASLWSRWYQRRRLMHLVNGFRRLMMKKPHVKLGSMWMRSNMLHEYIFVMMSTVRIIGVFASLWSRWNQRRRLIQLVNGFRRLMIKKPHGFCTTLIYYLTFVASIYLSYSAYRYGFAGMGWSTLGEILILCGIIAYYTDTYLVGSLMLYTIEAHAEMVKLMEERTLFPRNLDERLEKSFEKFQLQLVRNPFKMTVMGLFTVKRSNSIVLGHSVITHSLFLIQYEIQNY